MLRKYNIILALLTLIITVHADENKIDDWYYQKEVSIPDSSKEYSSLFLDKEVYRYLDNSLESIRIVDESDNFVPYYFDNDYKTEEKVTKTFQSKRINKENVELTKIEYDQIDYNKEELNIEEKVYKTFYDFQILPTDDSVSGKLLQLDIDGDTFSKKITIWGRNEKTDWTEIGSDTIYNFDGYKKLDVNFDMVQYYSFYRLVLYNNKENIDIKELTLVHDTYVVETERFMEQEEISFTAENKDKTTVITLDNPDNLRITSLLINAEGAYKRDYTVKRVLDGEEYSTYISGKIFNFKFNDIDINSNTIDVGDIFNSCDQLKIIIDNKDNPSIKIDSIRAQYLIDKIVFKTDRNSNYRLLFGNDEVSRPVYDIEDFKQYIKAEDISEANLTEITILREKGITEKLPLQNIFNILIIVVAIALFVIIIFILKPKK